MTLCVKIDGTLHISFEICLMINYETANNQTLTKYIWLIYTLLYFEAGKNLITWYFVFALG